MSDWPRANPDELAQEVARQERAGYAGSYLETRVGSKV